MAETIWEYSDKQVNEKSSFYTQLGKASILVRSNQGKLAEHTITKENSDIPKNAQIVSLSPSFDVVPLAHSEVQIGQSKIYKKHKLTESIVLRSFTSKNDHLLPFLLHQVALESDLENVVVAYVNEENLSLVYCSNKACMLANSFTLKDAKELVYFFTSVANQHGKSIGDIHFKLYSSLDADMLKKILDDYVPKSEIVKFELPYESDKMPPFSAESYILLKLGECELPAEI